MKYLVPLLLFAAPLCPQTNLAGAWYVAYFVAGVFSAIWAYDKADSPFISSYSECKNG